MQPEATTVEDTTMSTVKLDLVKIGAIKTNNGPRRHVATVFITASVFLSMRDTRRPVTDCNPTVNQVLLSNPLKKT